MVWTAPAAARDQRGVPRDGAEGGARQIEPDHVRHRHLLPGPSAECAEALHCDAVGLQAGLPAVVPGVADLHALAAVHPLLAAPGEQHAPVGGAAGRDHGRKATTEVCQFALWRDDSWYACMHMYVYGIFLL